MALLELLNHAIQIRIACAKASCEPVSTALRDSLAIGEHLKLASLARRNHGFNAQPLFNQGHETRDLGFVVLSRWAGTYLNFHGVLQVVWYGCLNPVSQWITRYRENRRRCEARLYLIVMTSSTSNNPPADFQAPGKSDNPAALAEVVDSFMDYLEG